MSADARLVLSHYPSAVADLVWVRLGSGGGFSGASLWRGDLHGTPAFALKAWPPGYPFGRLETIHNWMRQARDRGLTFVPPVMGTRDGRTWVEHAGRAWDVVSWAPGAADFQTTPSDARLAAACQTLAELHAAWAPERTIAATCPAVQRRLEVLARSWDGLVSRRHGPVAETGTLSGSHDLTSLVSRARELLPSRIACALNELDPWKSRPVPVQPCLCDVWHDHVLFTGDAVTGVIDYGAMKFDHPAVDLARLLGDLVGDDLARLRFGLDAYRNAGGPLPVDEAFVSLLDRTGVVCAVLHWLRRLDVNLPISDSDAVTQRLARLVTRLGDVFPSSWH